MVRFADGDASGRGPFDRLCGAAAAAVGGGPGNFDDRRLAAAPRQLLEGELDHRVGLDDADLPPKAVRRRTGRGWVQMFSHALRPSPLFELLLLLPRALELVGGSDGLERRLWLRLRLRARL